MIRKGIPPALRCAVWLSNVIQSAHPHQDLTYWHEYRTLAKVRALDGAYDFVTQKLSATLSEDSFSSVAPPTFGQINSPAIPGTTETGHMACTRVLLALDHTSGLDAAPMIPTLVQLLLTNMSESYCFCAVREMTHHASWYFPTSARERVAWCRAFGHVMKKLHAATAAYLEDRCVLDDDNLTPLFQDMFVGILPVQYVLRIVDIYTLEGFKALFRFGVALLVLYKMDSAEQLATISNAKEWWTGMREWAHSKRFYFELVVRKAYGLHGRGIRRGLRFPRRQILQRIIRMEEERQQVDDDQYEAPALPVGLVVPTDTTILLPGEELILPVLAQSTKVRQYIAEWLPISLRMTNLELLYSTNYHGRSLEMFYHCVANAKHTVLVCETYPETITGHAAAASTPTIIGMYASQVWQVSPRVYGDGGCFLFRLDPDARCWKWKPKPPEGTSATHANALDGVDLEGDDTDTNETALLEQFMVGTRTYISMGGNADGSAGFRLNDDLTKGESSTAAGFENEPLHAGGGSVFEVGLVEVYGLVRQMDGRAA
jgi:hypothetical protein